MTQKKHKKLMNPWPPPPWVSTDPIKIFNELRQPHWNVIRCPVCGKTAVTQCSIEPIIHVSEKHVAIYEVIAARLTWKQAREVAGRNSDVFGIFTKYPEEWEKAIQMLDDLAGVEMKEDFKHK